LGENKQYEKEGRKPKPTVTRRGAQSDPERGRGSVTQKRKDRRQAQLCLHWSMKRSITIRVEKIKLGRMHAKTTINKVAERGQKKNFKRRRTAMCICK